MKTLNQETFENFNEFLLTDEEMTNVRGGDGGGVRRKLSPPATEA